MFGRCNPMLVMSLPVSARQIGGCTMECVVRVVVFPLAAIAHHRAQVVCWWRYHLPHKTPLFVCTCSGWRLLSGVLFSCVHMECESV
mmetsp:Transcript_67514/g.166786  ORF Transcript_67514/g.166786 Transcript_67514/m.166786 type:complete len:87 (-) Transcript_67514:1312-1572(-)